MFVQNPFSPSLHHHPLSGEFSNYRSINITGDYRALYKQIDKNHVIFVKLGTHSQLYK